MASTKFFGLRSSLLSSLWPSPTTQRGRQTLFGGQNLALLFSVCVFLTSPHISHLFSPPSFFSSCLFGHAPISPIGLAAAQSLRDTPAVALLSPRRCRRNPLISKHPSPALPPHHTFPSRRTSKDCTCGRSSMEKFPAAYSGRCCISYGFLA